MVYKPFACAALLTIPAIAAAGELGADTAAAWDQYVASIKAQMKLRIDGVRPFLAVDAIPGAATRLRRNEVLVWPAEQHNPVRVPSGLIHHWVAAAFIPQATASDVLAALREYDRYSNFYAPSVIESKSLAETADDDRFTLRVVDKGILSKVALDADFQSSYFLNGARGYKTMYATRVQQIEDFGQRDQHMLPADQGTGLVWRLYTIARFEQRDGGVYLEIDSMALSRDIPASIQWIVSPMIHRVAKNALSGMLQKTRTAVLDSMEMARHDSPRSNSRADAGAPLRVSTNR